jgi:CBS domain-containing protein
MGLIAQLLEKRSPVVHIVSPHQTVAEAVAIMASRKIGAVPVVEDGRLVGIFSERDVVRRVVWVNRSPEKTEIGEVMTPPAHRPRRATSARSPCARWTHRLPPPAR